MGRYCIISIITSIFTFNSVAWGGQYYYVVQQNDRASEILHKAQLNPIYTKQGSLNSLRETNPNIDDIDHIFPGQKLFFSSDFGDQAKLSGAIDILETGEIVFNQDGIGKSDLQQPQPDRQIASQSETQTETLMPVITPKVSSSDQVDSIPEKQSTEIQNVDFSHQPQSEFKFTLGMGYSRIDSTQNSTAANFISKAIPSASAQWQQNWSPSWQTHACWQTAITEFEETSRGTFEGSHKVSTSSFGFGATYIFDSNLHLKSEFGMTEQIFATSASLGTAKLQTRPIPYLGVSLGKKLLEVRRLSLAAEFGGKYLMNSSGEDFDVHSGSELSAKISVEHKLKSMTIFVSGQFSKVNQNTSQSNQVTTDLKSQFGISIPLGGEE